MFDPWRDRAACLGHPDPEMFHPHESDHIGQEHAIAVCAGCTVVVECGDYADARGSSGVWGGVWRKGTGRRRGKTTTEETD